MKLPEPDFIPLADIVQKWGITEAHVRHYVGNGLLDIYVEVYKPGDIASLKLFRLSISAALELLYNKKGVWIEDPHTWKAFFLISPELLVSTKEIAVFETLCCINEDEDVAPVEGIETEPETAKKSKKERQINAISEALNRLGYDPLAIPTGGKTEAQKICEKNEVEKGLFSPNTSFENAWKAARKLGIVKMRDSEKFSSN